MTSELKTLENENSSVVSEVDLLDEVPADVEMSLFDHLEELRMRIFYSLLAVLVGVVVCFLKVNWIVELLEVRLSGLPRHHGELW